MGGNDQQVALPNHSEELTFVYMVRRPTDLPYKIAAVVREAIAG